MRRLLLQLAWQAGGEAILDVDAWAKRMSAPQFDEWCAARLLGILPDYRSLEQRIEQDGRPQTSDEMLARLRMSHR